MDPIDFYNIFAAAPSPCLLLAPDADFTIIAANDGYLKATLTTREQLVGQKLFDAFPDNPGDPQATGVRNLRASLELVLNSRAADTMAVQKYDIPRPASEGGGFEERYWSPINSPVFGPSGKVAHIIHRVEDVTEFVRLKAREGERDRQTEELRGRADRMEAEVLQRARELADANQRLRATNDELQRQGEEQAKAEAALYREQDFLRAVLEHASDGIVACDGEGVLRFFNRATCEFLGLLEEPLPPERWAEHYNLYLPDGRTRMTKEQVPLFRALAGGMVKDVEMVIAADGQPPRLLTANGTSITGPDGKRLGAVVVMHDLTARKHAEEQQERALREEAARKGAEVASRRLAESDARLRLILESTKDYAIFSTDPDGRVTSWNGGAERVFGYAEADMVGRDAVALFTPEDRAGGVPEAELANAREKGCADDQRWHQRKDGSRFFASGTVNPVRDGGGTLLGFTKICRDLTEWKQLEMEREQLLGALTNERTKLASIIERSPAFICTLRGPEHIFELANERYYEIVGRRDIIGRTVRVALPEVEGQGFFELLDAVYRTGEACAGDEVPLLLRRTGGETLDRRVVNFVYQPLREPDGSISGVFAHGVDVTELVNSRDAVREGEAYLRASLDSSAGGFYGVDREGVTTVLNAAFLKMLGFGRAEDAMGRKLHDVIHHTRPDGTQYPKEHCPIYRAARTGQPAHMEGELFFRLDGTSFPVEYWTQPIVRDGEVRGAVTTFTDITERNRAEAALRASQRRLDSLIDSNIIGVHICDEERVLEANDAYLRIVGYSRGELEAGQIAWRDITPSEYLSFDEKAIDEIKKRGACTPFEKEYIRKDGTRVPILLGIASVEESKAKYICLVQDLTPQKQAERARLSFLDKERAARAEAERASQMKDEFLATLSHELRTPLNAILGWSQILAGGGRDAEDLAEGLRIIERNARAQTQIIEDLLDMSRIISGKVRLDVQRLDLTAVVRGAMETLKPAADAKGVRLLAVLDPLAGPVSGDPNRLQQVFWNLLTNAVKFTPRGGGVQVSLDQVTSHLEVSIIDTGEGIKSDFLPHVFDRFRQSDGSTTRRHGGLGLGLAIVKQLVELHGGSVRAESQGEGKGATFTVSLPLTVPPADPESSPERGHPLSQSGPVVPTTCARIDGLRVLVVDDEPDTRALIKRLLEDCKAEVSMAASAAEALELIKKQPPEVLVSDIGMPGEDGYSLIRSVRRLAPDAGGAVPALALTAYARSEDRKRAILSGYQMHLLKPVEPSELIAMVASLAGRTGTDREH